MSAAAPPPEASTGIPPTCYRHPGRETYISCQRCGRPICPDCMHPASVGFQCPECVRIGNAQSRSPRTAFGGRAGAAMPIVTLVLIGLNVLVFLLVNATGGINGRVGRQLIELPSSAGYAPRYNGIAEGAYWQLLTSVFTHTEILHIAMNMIGLYIFGAMLEHVLGRWRFLALYLISGFVGSVAVYLLAPPAGAALGASGAVFGLFGAAFVVLLRQHRDVTQLVILLALNLFISFTVSNIAWQAHIGGLLAGFAIGAAYAYPPRSMRTPVAASVLVGLVALGVVVTILRTAALTT